MTKFRVNEDVINISDEDKKRNMETFFSLLCKMSNLKNYECIANVEKNQVEIIEYI